MRANCQFPLPRRKSFCENRDKLRFPSNGRCAFADVSRIPPEIQAKRKADRREILKFRRELRVNSPARSPRSEQSCKANPRRLPSPRKIERCDQSLFVRVKKVTTSASGTLAGKRVRRFCSLSVSQRAGIKFNNSQVLNWVCKNFCST